MIVYLFVLLATCIPAYSARYCKSKFGCRVLLAIPFVCAVLVAGLRHRAVGTDSGGYVRILEGTASFEDVLEKTAATGEFGFSLLTFCVRVVSTHYLLYFIVLAVIVVGFYYRSIYSYSLNKVVSLYLFVTMGFYTFFFNGARQGIACAICAVSIGALVKRRFALYCLIVLCAALFHKSAIIMLPVYFLVVRRSNWMTVSAYCCFAVAIALSMESLVYFASEFDSRYATYAVSGEGGGFLIVAFNVLLALFFFFQKESVKLSRYTYEIYLNMLILGALAGLVSALLKVNPSGILRFLMYFNVSVIFLWPIVFRNIREDSQRLTYQCVFYIGYLVFFILTTMRFSNLVPYIINDSLK